jgi:phage recombination protein Bet
MASKAIQPARPGGVTERSRAAWTEEQINLIAATVAEGATRPQLFMFLELASKYDLDPFAKEIWCAVPKAVDGSARTDKVMIMVGRDGFLKIAQRHPDYRGMDSDVVRENDDFAVERLEDGRRLITHRYGRERGKPVAAYAVVLREGRLPTYFHAPIEDFKPSGASSYSQWSKGPGTMILKCAEAGALRRAFSITGIVAEEEVAHHFDTQVEAPEPDAPPEMVDRIRSLFDQARMLDQDAYTPAKQRLMLAGVSEERLGQIEQELRTFIVACGGVVAETVTDVVDEPDEPGQPNPEPEPTEPQPEPDSERFTPEQVESMNQTLALPVEESDPVREAAERAGKALGFDASLPPEQSGLLDGEPEEAESVEQIPEGELDFDGGDDGSP